jgi:hypothetical protein
MAHTPGPWEWYFRLGKNLESDCGVFHDDNGKAYSVCRCPRYQGEKQWEDDARLIAAAPDLLEALKGELAEGRSDCNDRRCGACSRCRSYAAITKAEGKE